MGHRSQIYSRTKGSNCTTQYPILTFWTACWAASRVVNVTNAYPLFVPVIGSIISLRSHMVPHTSNNGMSSSSYISLGILPQKTSQPAPGGEPSHPGGGPPYLRWPKIYKSQTNGYAWWKSTKSEYMYFICIEQSF